MLMFALSLRSTIPVNLFQGQDFAQRARLKQGAQMLTNANRMLLVANQMLRNANRMLTGGATGQAPLGVSGM